MLERLKWLLFAAGHSNTFALVSNMLEIQALIRILEKKGITSQDEIFDEVKKFQVEMEDKIKKMGRVN